MNKTKTNKPKKNNKDEYECEGSKALKEIISEVAREYPEGEREQLEEDAYFDLANPSYTKEEHELLENLHNQLTADEWHRIGPTMVIEWGRLITQYNELCESAKEVVQIQQASNKKEIRALQKVIESHEAAEAESKVKKSKQATKASNASHAKTNAAKAEVIRLYEERYKERCECKDKEKKFSKSQAVNEIMEILKMGVSLISCSRHNMLARRMYATQTEDPTGRIADDPSGTA